MERNSGYATSFVLGGLIGAGLALVLAPRSGRETRALIATRARDGALRGRELKDRVVEKSRALADDAASFVERQRQGLQAGKERIAAAVEAGREAFREEKRQSEI
jgi:gas vesicle protein